MSSLFTVLTTIQPPTRAVHELHRRLAEGPTRLVVAGDKKGPESFALSNCDFLSLADQETSGFSLVKDLPDGHYARKNIGYLHAIRAGATCLYETDDDNAPLPGWQPRIEIVENTRQVSPSLEPSWVNVYRLFTQDSQIWPRGFPLQHLADAAPVCKPERTSVQAPVQQGLVNASPDVDAVWRLTQDRPFDFDNRPSVFLGKGQWCPFNTQSTWWWPVAFPLLYIPSFCSFRMCDIWKSFVAQRCLWAMGSGVVFHAPEVRQDRNPHDYLRDFNDEIPGVLQNEKIAEILGNLSLATGAEAAAVNLHACYAALVGEGIFPAKEMKLVEAWISDIGSLVG